MSSSNTPRLNLTSSKRPSPSNSLSKTGNPSQSGQKHSKTLSGISLKIKESAVELMNFEKQWNKLHASGLLILNSIRNLKIDNMRGVEPELYPKGLQQRCDQLQVVIDKMKSSFSNLEILVNQLKALVELDRLQGGNNGPILLSWSTSKFGQAYQEIYNAYAKELALKNAVKEEVAHSASKESLIFYISSWTQQPFLTNDCKTLLEIIFYETDLR